MKNVSTLLSFSICSQTSNCYVFRRTSAFGKSIFDNLFFTAALFSILTPFATFLSLFFSEGVFERPADISKAYGGGRKVGVGGYQPTQEELEEDTRRYARLCRPFWPLK